MFSHLIIKTDKILQGLSSPEHDMTRRACSSGRKEGRLFIKALLSNICFVFGEYRFKDALKRKKGSLFIKLC